jgi:DNA polymerase III delta prime subunit
MQNTVYFGDRRVVIEEVKRELDMELRMQCGYGLEQVNVFELDQMQIRVDDIRRMKNFCYKTSENVKTILLSSFYWSDEVQNAMLKVLEETPPNTFIFLFGLSQKYFLPTVLSRIQKVNKKNTNRYLKEAKEILSLPPNDRPDNKIVKKILGLKVVDMNYEKNLENEKKDREAQILFLLALIHVILESGVVKDKGFLEKINTLTQLADIEGGNPTLFIDWLLLTAPSIAV